MRAGAQYASLAPSARVAAPSPGSPRAPSAPSPASTAAVVQAPPALGTHTPSSGPSISTAILDLSPLSEPATGFRHTDRPTIDRARHFERAAIESILDCCLDQLYGMSF